MRGPNFTGMSTRRKAILDWVLPIGILIALTVPFWTTNVDVRVAGHFYTPGIGWALAGHDPWRFLYRFGPLPAWVVSVAGLAVFAASFGNERFRSHRRAALYLVLVMMMGPGLLTNTVFKQHWGRPRPRDLVEFGGQHEYVKPWVKSPSPNGHSFPSGHAASGFYLLTPYFLLRRRSRRYAAAFFALGLAYGSWVGLARMIQGAHFLSDVLWAFGFVYMSGLALLYALHLNVDRG
jgi:lipid A 4'-phosphatase